MPAKITRDIIESFLNCKHKAHLKLTGQQGIKSDYENMLSEMRAEVRSVAVGKILNAHQAEKNSTSVNLTTSVLKQESPFLLDTTLEDDIFSLKFDGLKKVDGSSKLGNFHYIPVIFHEGRQVRKEQRLLLELYGMILSRIQGQIPSKGIIWHGKDCQTTTVRLNADLRQTERLLREPSGNIAQG